MSRGQVRKKLVMAEENVFFLPVKNFGRRDLMTCSIDSPLVDAAALMRQHNISSIIVVDHEEPVGIFTDRDLRNKVIALGKDPDSLQARSIMSAPLIVVNEEDFLFEALYRMSRHKIHRVCVVDADGRLTGIITDSDILNLQTRSPQKMLRDIEEANSLAELSGLHLQIQDLVLHLVGTGAETRNLVRMIAHLNDHLLIRLIEILRADKFPNLTDRFAFVVLGSEGRREQTLATDQDNAIIFADDLSAEEKSQIETFSHALIDMLIGIGVPPCPGGIMAKNPFWRRSLSEWSKLVVGWMSTPTPENILNGSMFFDIRTIYGDPSFEQELKSRIAEHLHRNSMFLAHTAVNVLSFKVPLGWFGRIKTVKKGEHLGKFDIKKAGIFAVTEGIKVLALEAGLLSGGTHERLQELVNATILTPELALDIEESFNFLIFLRLRGQVKAIREGREPGNFLSLKLLNRMEKERLKMALREVGSFQDFLERHFRLDLIDR